MAWTYRLNPLNVYLSCQTLRVWWFITKGMEGKNAKFQLKIFKILPSGPQKSKSVKTVIGSLPLLVVLLLNSYCPNH